MNKKKQYNRYIPIPIKDELDKLEHPRKDNLNTIIDLINRKEIYFKSDLQKTYGYTEIALAQFKELLPSSDNLNSDLDFLIDKGFIRRNDFYTIGYKSKGYKISSEYLGKAIGIKIQNDKINKRIAKQIDKYKRLKVKNLEFAKTQYFKNFKIDIQGANNAILEKAMAEILELCKQLNLLIQKPEAKEIIECTLKSSKNRNRILSAEGGKELLSILHRYMVYSTRINAINDGFLFFKRNKTNGRLDSNLTSLPSFLRQFIISEEPLVNIDIKNSQPYFLYCLIKNKTEIEKSELGKYEKLVISGELYDYLKDKYNSVHNQYYNREQMKKVLFKIFYSKIKSFPKYKQFFKSEFPTIMEHISNTNSLIHNTLAIQLQTIESFSILDVVMPLLEKESIRPYTIHDSFVCIKSQSGRIQEIFNSKFLELYGVAPSLHIDFIDEVEDDESENNLSWLDEMESIEHEEDLKQDGPIKVILLEKRNEKEKMRFFEN